MLRKIEAYLFPSKIDALQDALLTLGIEGMSTCEYKGYGTRSKLVNGKPRLEDRTKVEIVVGEDVVETVVGTIRRLSRDGQIGSGMIFVMPVEDAIRLKTREAGKTAII